MLVTIKPGTGSHTTWQDGQPVLQTAESDPFEVSEDVFNAFSHKFDKVEEKKPSSKKAEK